MFFSWDSNQSFIIISTDDGGDGKDTETSEICFKFYSNKNASVVELCIENLQEDQSI